MPLISSRDVLLKAADILDPQRANSNEWWFANPDPSVVDPDRLTPDGLVKGRARPKQRPPSGRDWFVWMVMAGRGSGKTRTGGEWIDSVARSSKRGSQLLIAGRTPSDVRDYALNGEGGLLRHHPDIRHEQSNRLLVWPNGVQGLIRSGANPEEFRGFSGEYAWLDELAAWDYPQDCWDNLIFGMRERNPQLCVTTTPRAIKLIKTIIASAGTVLVKDSSYSNRANLSEKWFKEVIEPLAGTRLGRQEIEAEIVEDTEGALWNLSMIEDLKVRREKVPDLKRIVIGVDPQGTKTTEILSIKDDVTVWKHETGIVAVGIGENNHLYVLEDGTINGSPAEWGRRAVAVFERHRADRIVGEKNFGGDMVESTIRAIKRDVPYANVSATRGKTQRAEPIAALYEQGRVHHVGTFAALEDEMTTFTPGTKQSPNRMDALVWAATELSVTPPEYSELVWGRRI